MKKATESKFELTILMPCLNEAETLGICIKKAKQFLADNGVAGEILIADNGSSDGSQQLAIDAGARVVHIAERGYGAALIGGCTAALGEYVIMADADDSYNFLELMPFVQKLREGYELVMGNRFLGGIAKGAMPPLHRYLGNPVLSFLGRIFFPSNIKDFHCGLRGYNTQSMRKLNLRTTGMEYASEMVVQATLNNFKMIEVPTTLSPDGRSRSPHLNSWSDGWRHLKFLLMHSPKWLFLYPGLLLVILGFILLVVLSFGSVTIKEVTFDIHTQLYAGIMMIVGVQTIMFFKFTKTYAANTGFIPSKSGSTNTNKGILLGVLLLLLGIGATVVAFIMWGKVSFGDIKPQEMMRITLPALVSVCIGVQLIFGNFFIEILNIKHN